MTFTHRLRFFLLAFVVFPSAVFAQTTGSIHGTVTDPSGAVIAGAKVTATSPETQASHEAATNANGEFKFPILAVGHYSIEVEASGFKKYVQKDIDVTIGHVVIVDAKLELGAATQEINVNAAAPLVEATSTQLGAVVNSQTVTELPLNTRDTFQLLQLQPGVQSELGSNLFYGSDQPGVVSVNGGRGRSNNYTVNGGDSNDQFVNLPAVQPSPDSIQEFRVLTNTFDAEYGRNSGSVVNVVTKSGTNNFHGDVFEFFRNGVLNSRGYFDIVKPQFQQNQFGGTIGGPIKKNNTFFFASYEGRSINRGTSPPSIPFVPTAEERAGDFPHGGNIGAFGGSISPFSASFASDLASRTTGSANGTTCQQAVTKEGGAPIAVGQPYSAIFPNNQIPMECFDPTALDLMNQFVPLPNFNGSQFSSVPVSTVRATQFSVRLDHKINNNQQLSLYYYFDDDSIFDSFSTFQAAGANVPGFGGLFADRYQQLNFTHTWTIGATTVNEARFTYFRQGQETLNHPQRTNLVQDSCATVPASQCFTGVSSGSNIGITPGLGANREGVPNIVVSGGFNIGNNFEGELPQVGNTYQWADSLTKIIGNHTLKFGGDVRYQSFNQTIFFDVNGEYFFFGGEPNDITPSNGSFFPDYLLGLPDEYIQAAPEVMNLRSTSVYLFGQDSWKIRPNVTLNYGLRWELNTPYTDVQRKLQTFRPGEATTQFPCQLMPTNPLSVNLIATFGSTDCGPNGPANAVFPLGMVFPGDKGVPAGTTQTYYKSFAPRIGLAWSPGWNHGWLQKLTGGPGNTSVRMGFGMFYNPIEQLVLEQGGGAPFGGNIVLTGTTFNTPFLDQFGTVHPNPYGGIREPARGTPIDFSTFRPILLFGALEPNLRSQYSEQYNLVIQRQLTRDTVLDFGYVGSQGHRLLASRDLNPGNAQTCLGLQALSNFYGDPANGSQHDPGLSASLTCGPFFADFPFFIPPTNVNGAQTVIPAGVTLTLPYGNVPSITGPTTVASVAPNGIDLVGLRKYSSPMCQPTTGGTGCPPDGIPVFSSIFTQNTIANADYNSFQLSVEKRFSHGFQLLGAYTWSKSFDEASSFENILNPINPALSRALSLFNSNQRFVLSYYWQLPLPTKQGFAGKALEGWAVSGITTFQSGFPIRITSSSDFELENSFDFELPGQPDVIAPFHTQNPRNSGCAIGTGPTSGTKPPIPCQQVPNQYFDPNSFTNQAMGTIGSAPRSICCGPGINNFDFGFLKNTAINERWNVQFRAEFFNIWNHAQFFQPDGNITDGVTFGQISKARDPRLIQFGLKILF
jgi:hypothetical protein